MATNTYFKHNSITVDTTLIRKLVQESIKQVGFNCWYMPRTEDNVDAVLQEAARVRYDNAYQVEMYVDDPVDALANSIDYVGQFGFEVRDSCDFTIAQQTFIDLSVSGREVPKEGDLIYAPLFGQMYEIKFVEDMNPFFQAGATHTFILMSRLFIYDDQEFNITTSDATVNAAIESLETERSYHIDLVMDSGGTGSFSVASNVYQGVSLGTATARGEVVSWDADTYTLRIINTSGTWALSTLITDGTASWTLASYDDMKMEGDLFAQNVEIETSADGGIVDFTETNPFGSF